MFAIFFSDKMDGFYAIITSFPTVVYTVCLIVCVFYWLIAFLGAIDFDILDIDASEGDGAVNGVAGLLMKLGLDGVPLPIVFSFISGIAWFISYYSVYFLYPIVPDFLEWLVAIAIFLASLYLAAIATSFIVRPLRKFFKQVDQLTEKSILGQTAIVRTGRVDREFGEAAVEDGGAGLIVKIRSYKDEVFKRGDRVVLLELIEEEGFYRVISESDFKE